VDGQIHLRNPDSVAVIFLAVEDDLPGGVAALVLD
jgi:hypothetical protein